MASRSPPLSMRTFAWSMGEDAPFKRSTYGSRRLGAWAAELSDEVEDVAQDARPRPPLEKTTLRSARSATTGERMPLSVATRAAHRGTGAQAAAVPRARDKASPPEEERAPREGAAAEEAERRRAQASP